MKKSPVIASLLSAILVHPVSYLTDMTKSNAEDTLSIRHVSLFITATEISPCLTICVFIECELLLKFFSDTMYSTCPVRGNMSTASERYWHFGKCLRLLFSKSSAMIFMPTVRDCSFVVSPTHIQTVHLYLVRGCRALWNRFQ